MMFAVFCIFLAFFLFRILLYSIRMTWSLTKAVLWIFFLPLGLFFPVFFGILKAGFGILLIAGLFTLFLPRAAA